MSDDDNFSYTSVVSTVASSKATASRFSAAETNNNVYAELVHAGFRPPQVYQPDRAMNRRRGRFNQKSSDDNFDVTDENTTVVGRVRPRPRITMNYDDNNDVDLGSDQDTKPRAIERIAVVPSKEHSNAAVVNTTQIVKKKNRPKKEKPIPTGGHSTEQELPLQLVHKLIEPVGGRRKRKRVKDDDLNDDIQVLAKPPTTAEDQKQKGTTTTTTTIRNVTSTTNDSNINDQNDNTTNHPAPLPLPEPVSVPPPIPVELPPSAIIRGSITHNILQKLKRLNDTLLYDDPFLKNYKNTEECKDNTIIIHNNNPQLPPTTVTSKKLLSLNGKHHKKQTTLNENALCVVGNASNAIGNMVKDHTSSVAATAKVIAKECVCIRSTVLPQYSTKSPLPRYTVVILEGPHKGRTGYIVDEIDGQYSVIQSDDPDDINNKELTTWTVNNMSISTVAEFMKGKQQQRHGKQQPPRPTLTSPSTAQLENERMATTTASSKRNNQDLFLTCLDKELTSNEHT